MESSAIAGDRIENMVAEEQVEVVVNSGDDDGEAWGPLYKCGSIVATTIKTRENITRRKLGEVC